MDSIDFNLKISPNLEVDKLPNNNTLVNNRVTGSSILFEGLDILVLLDLFKRPQSVRGIVKNVLGGSVESNDSLIRRLVEWDILIVDLGLSLRDCPLCMINTPEDYVSVHDPFYQEQFNYVKCKSCGLVYLNPCPAESAYDFYYFYRNYYSECTLKMVNNYELKLQQISNLKRETILCRCFPFNKENSLLDVGCGTGDFLIHMQKKYNAFSMGVDRDPIAIESMMLKCSDILGKQGIFNQIDFGLKKFDVISMWGYLEHELYPFEALKKCYEILNSNGIIIIEVPDIDSKISKLLLKSWPYLHPPYHSSHFNRSTIIQLISNAGFKLENIFFDKTGPYLLKYSDILLFVIYYFKLFYSSHLIDYAIYLLSRPLKYIESIFNLNERIVVIAKK